MGVVQWVARLTRNIGRPIVGSSPIKCPRCCHEQETLSVLLVYMNGFERDFTWNLTKLKALWKIDLNVKYAPSLNIVKQKQKL